MPCSPHYHASRQGFCLSRNPWERNSFYASLSNHSTDPMKPIGYKTWAIAEGYIPSESTGPAPAMTSHETACILNAGDADAHIRIMMYFTDRAPAGPYRLEVPARRTSHLRFNDLKDPEPVPRDTPYASVIISDVPVVVQHTRLDSRQAANALLSTIAFHASE